jgi:uncharacterized protein (DUF697 family)
MHNLSNEYFQNEFESAYNNEQGYEFNNEFEYENGYSNETNYELSPEFEFENPQYEVESELAQELIEVSNESEFGGWLKGALKKGAGIASNFLNSPAGKNATSTLNNIATKTLPGYAAKAGGWLGNNVGGTLGNSSMGRRLGSQIGRNLGNAAGGAYQDFAKFATDAVADMAREYEVGVQKPAIKPAIVKSASKNYPMILRIKGRISAMPVNGQMQQEYEYNGEYNNEYEYHNEYSNEYDNETMHGEISHNEGTFSEITEMELASELLNVQSEAELDRFLGKLMSKAVGAVSKFAKSGAGRALGGMLKGIAKKALPIAGAAVGTALLPGIGTSVGGVLGNMAGNLFELELEGLSPEDREFELAKAYVRFAGNASRRASRMRGGSPGSVARQAVGHASRRYAPGLYPGGRTNSTYIYDQRNSFGDGTWYREGNKIIIEGA